MYKNAKDKGITLTSLVVTIVILLILSTIAYETGKGTIESARLSAYRAEMTIMQEEVDNLEQQFRQGKLSEAQLTMLGQDITEAEGAEEALNEAGVTDTSGYKYFTAEALKSLGIENVENDYLINIQKRSVISLNGVKYHGEKYYTLADVPGGKYIVEKQDITSTVNFDVASDIQGSGMKIVVSNITYTGNVKKGSIYYGIEDASGNVTSWTRVKNETTDTSCTIDVLREGTYKVKVVPTTDNPEDDATIKEVAVYQASYIIAETGTKYSTLAEAFNASENGQTITQTRNCADSSEAAVDGKSITFNTNGKETTKKANTITVNSGATLTVVGNGSIKTTEGIVAITNNGTITIGDQTAPLSTSSPTIQGGTYGVNTTGTFNFYNGSIKGTTDAYNTAPTATRENYDVITGTETINSTEYKIATLGISTVTVHAPTNLAVSTGGIVTWTNSDNATGYQISIDGTNYTDATSGIDYLSTITETAGEKTIYVKAVNNDTENYESTNASIATVTVTVYTVNFESNDTSKGTVSPTSKNVIAGATYSTSGNTLTLTGITTGTTTTTLATVTATASPGYGVSSWSSTSGNIISNTTITVTFTEVYLIAEVKPEEYSIPEEFLGTGIARERINTISCATSITGHTVDNTTCWDVGTVPGNVLMWIAGGNETDGYDIVIGQNGGVYGNPNSSYLFSGLYNLTSLDLSNFNTASVTNMSYMFYSCGTNAMTSLDLGDKFDTSNVTNMGSMFSSCGYTAMTSLDLGGKFDTSNVTNMGSMFNSCGYGAMTSLNLGDKFDTSNVTNMGSMFYSCGYGAMTSLDLGDKFDTSNVTDMSYMFDYCGYTAMTSLDLGDNFDTSNVTDMSGMFYYCGYTAMTSLDLGEKFDTSNVTNMSYMFSSCGSTAMTSLDLGDKFDTSNVTNMSNMFSRCGYTAMTSLDLGDKFDTSNVTSMMSMFSSCGYNAMTSLDLGDKFDTSNVTSMMSMFSGCGYNAMTNLDLGDKFDTSKVTDMGFMFSNCGRNAMTNLDLGDKFDTSNVTYMNRMFMACGLSKMTSLDLGNKFDTSNVRIMSYMFCNCGFNAMTSLDLGDKFDTSKVTDMSSMFRSVNYRTIYAYSDFDTSNLFNSQDMFYGSHHLVGGNGTIYSDSHVDASYANIDRNGKRGYFTQAAMNTNTTDITVNAKESYTASFKGIIGNLSIDSEIDNSKINVEISNKNVIITGVDVGTTSITVRESDKNQTITLQITVLPSNYIIDNTLYAVSLAEAIATASEGSTIKLQRDYYDSRIATINKNVTLDLQTYTLRRVNTITISTSKDVTITGSTGSKLTTGTANISTIVNQGTLTISESVTIEHDGTNTAYYAINNSAEGAILNVKSGTIISTTYGIYNNSTAVTNIGDSTQTVNTSNPVIIGGTHGVYRYSGTINFYNGILKGTTAGYYGTIASTRAGYGIATGTEDIDGTTYNTAFLERLIPNYIVDNNIEAQTLEEAVVAASDGSTIKLIRDCTDTVAATINKNVTLDLQTYTLTRDKTITVSSGANATITGSTGSKLTTGTLNVDTIDNQGTLTIDGSITIEHNGTNTSYYAINNSTAGAILNVKSGTVTSATYGIYNNNGTAVTNIGDSTEAVSTTNPTISGGTYGIYNNSGKWTYNNGTIQGTTSSFYDNDTTTNGGLEGGVRTDYIIVTGESGSYKTAHLEKMTDVTTPWLPSGASYTNTDLNTGVTMKDSHDNEWTWVVVPKTITASASLIGANDDPTDSALETALKNYAATVVARDSNYTDTWVSEEQSGFTSDEYTSKKRNMLNGIKKYGGFWIGKYEMGYLDTPTSSNYNSTTRTAVVQKDAYPYNYINLPNSALKTELLAMQTGCDGSLLFGTQWDLTIGYLVNRGGVSKNSATSNSTNWGIYSNKELTVTASTTKSGWPMGWTGTTSYNWATFTGTKSSGTSKLLSTGAAEDVTNKLNIVDLAGNCWEWTMEAYNTYHRAGRGRPLQF